MQFRKTVLTTLLTTAVLIISGTLQAAPIYDANVTNAAIYGSGNSNGSWTVDQNSATGVELGLRAKVRYDATNQPQNTFNSNGDGTYNHAVGAPTTGNPAIDARARWNFDWSINSNFNGAGSNLNSDLQFDLLIDFDPSAATNFTTLTDFLSVPGDHAFGNNSTGQGLGCSAGEGGLCGAPTYASLFANSNLVQNSSNLRFLSAGFDNTLDGTYSFVLRARRQDTLVSQTAMTVIVGAGGAAEVPEPATVGLFGLGLLGLVALRRRKAV